jgi:hypothetical protein
MKARKQQFHPVSVRWKRGYEFIRKGAVGDHKALFTDRHHAAFDGMVRAAFPHGVPAWARGLV